MVAISREDFICTVRLGIESAELGSQRTNVNNYRTRSVFGSEEVQPNLSVLLGRVELATLGSHSGTLECRRHEFSDNLLFGSERVVCRDRNCPVKKNQRGCLTNCA